MTNNCSSDSILIVNRQETRKRGDQVFNKNVLLSACAEIGMKPNEFRKLIDMPEDTWYNRLTGRRDWKLDEMDKVNSALVDRGWRGNPGKIWFYGTV